MTTKTDVLIPGITDLTSLGVLEDVVWRPGERPSRELSRLPRSALPTTEPVTTQPDIANNVTTEFYVGRGAEGEQVLGMVSTRHYFPEISAKRQYVNVNIGRASESYYDPDQGEGYYGEQSRLGLLAKALGFSFRRTVERGQVRLEGFSLAEPADINRRLAKLGVVDREVAAYEGGIAKDETVLEYISEGKILLANQLPTALHDRLVHVIADLLIPPRAWQAINQKAANMLEDLRNMAHMPDMDRRKLKWQIDNFGAALDTRKAWIGFNLANPTPENILKIEKYFADFGFSPDLAKEFTQEALTWTDKLLERADALTSTN